MCVKCQEAACLLEEWARKQGHNRCWYYPDVFRALARVLGVELTMTGEQLPRPEFEAGCTRFQDEEYAQVSRQEMLTDELLVGGKRVLKEGDIPSVRDYFAAAALQGVLAGREGCTARELAAAAYQLADAMMEARQ